MDVVSPFLSKVFLVIVASYNFSLVVMCLILFQILIEIPYLFVQTTVYALITYSMINFEWTAEKFFWYMYFMYFTFMYFTYYGMMMVALTVNAEVASIVASFFYSFFNLFSGFLIPKPVKKSFSKLLLLKLHFTESFTLLI